MHPLMRAKQGGDCRKQCPFAALWSDTVEGEEQFGR